MHSYIEFSKNYLEERDYEVLVIKEDVLVFKYEEFIFSFALKDTFPHSLPVMKTSKTFRKFPHFIEGKDLTSLCLGYEEDFNLYESTPEEIITETFERFFNLLNLSPDKQNKEFFKEFLHFWHKETTPNGNFKLYIKPKQHAEEIFIEEILPDKMKGKKVSRTKKRIAYSKDTFINDSNFKNGTKKKGVYIPLINVNSLSPFPENWNFKELFNYNISEESYKFLKEYNLKGNHIFIVFSMFIENEFQIMFTAEFSFTSSEENSLLLKISTELNKIKPFYSKRYDVNYLCQRIGSTLNCIDKKISIIGCGSLGSYIATEISKLGIANLDLFDSDFLTPENIFRHTLGISYSYFNKAVGLKIRLEVEFPHLKVTSYETNINHKNFLDYTFKDSDLLVFAIGNTATQLLINDLLIENNFNKPVLYTWLDSFGTGGHALLVDYSKKGCYKCLSLDANGEFMKESKISFSKNSDDIIYGDGCGGTFTPYGNTILLKGVSMITKIVLDFFNGKIFEKNPLFSTKNYIQDGLQYTERFSKSDTELFENYEYIVERCGCCDK